MKLYCGGQEKCRLTSVTNAVTSLFVSGSCIAEICWLTEETVTGIIILVQVAPATTGGGSKGTVEALNGM